MLNIAGLIVMIAVLAIISWSGVRALHAGNRLIRFGGTALAAILAILLGGTAALAITGLVKQHTRSAAVPTLKVEATPELVARGKAIADGFCSACHTETGTLSGGRDLSKDIPPPIGTLVSANLTPAGALKDWSDGDIFRAIRNSIDKAGNWLLIMSYTNAAHLSDSDIHAVIAYIRSLPATGEPTPQPPDGLNLLGLAMLGAGLLPSGNPVISGDITAPPKGPNVQFGAYIMSYQDCRACHGQDLTGGVQGQLPPVGSDLRVVKDWSRDGFFKTMRTGVDPYGHELNKDMPWKPIGRMDDDDLTAIYLYLVGTL